MSRRRKIFIGILGAIVLLVNLVILVLNVGEYSGKERLVKEMLPSSQLVFVGVLMWNALRPTRNG